MFDAVYRMIARQYVRSITIQPHHDVGRPQQGADERYRELKNLNGERSSGKTGRSAWEVNTVNQNVNHNMSGDRLYLVQFYIVDLGEWEKKNGIINNKTPPAVKLFGHTMVRGPLTEGQFIRMFSAKADNKKIIDVCKYPVIEYKVKNSWEIPLDAGGAVFDEITEKP